MSNCQKDVKLANVKKVKSLNYGGGSQKIINWHYEVCRYWCQKHFLCTFWGFLITIICDIKIDINMCEPHYVNFFFFWTSSTVHVFDFLTFDIFLTTWHLFDNLTSFWQLDIFLGHMGNMTHGQWDMGKHMVNIEDRDGVPWGMGHMGNWAHDHNFLNTAWIFTKILLDIDIDAFYLNI